MALYHFTTKPLSRGTRNTVGAIAYRAGCQLEDLKTGETFDYGHKPVQHVELVLPKDAPLWARNMQKLMIDDRQSGVQAFVDVVEGAEKRLNSRVWREFEFALHRELTDEQNIALAREFVEDQLCGRGMVAQLNFHFDVDKETGDYKPHCHATVTTRVLDESGMGIKERDWNKKELLVELREQWAHYSNFHLKLYGHDIQIDHRSYHEQGIEIEPQPKRCKSILEQEKMARGLTAQGSLEKDIVPLTDKQKAFQDVQLRNLYRILRRPEIILEIVTKHHATFMWADVQKKLHQYVDKAPLFQKIEGRLRSSNELVKLHSGGDQKETEDSLNGNVAHKAIYTTRSMLKAETSLVKIAETLGKSQIHGVEKNQVERAIMKAYQGLGIVGGLSLEQEKAIQHLVGEGQLNCVVGIAGSGKTTILGVCHEVWKSDGYGVYGLAPTGKAAQNLEQSGIQSTTVHKFLKEFNSGRCQYTSKSVLVLDEAGMVDVERFSSLLSAVKQLGVKLIVVGDGAQLQPVEAGPTFRLITERVGKTELTTVVRQKEDWQKEATVLFGKQKTREALQCYLEKGHVHIVEEKLPSLEEVLSQKDYGSLVKLYEISHRISSLMYREIARDSERTEKPPLIRNHQDFERYLTWKDLEKQSAKHILEESKVCKPFLEARCLDPTKMALLFVDKNQGASLQQEKAINTLKSCGLDSLIGREKPKEQGIEVRQAAKEALLNAWHSSYKACPRAQDPMETPEKSSLMIAFSNRDVNDLNKQARFLLKTSGQLDKQEFVYTTKKEADDDFGKKHTVSEKKGFSKGDRIVFTRNNYGLGVKNGSMGTITELTPQKINVKLDEGSNSKKDSTKEVPTKEDHSKGTLLKGTLLKGKEISFAPNLNPFFDHGWAITIHKSQGTTVDKTYVLASAEMNQNLGYVSMTRHREDVQVFGSSLDFWREEKLPDMLSKSGEKLSAADYLDANSLEELMRKEDHFLTKIFERVSDELESMGAISKKAFWQVADHFLGRSKEPEIRVNPDTFSRESIREEARAELILQNKQPHELIPSIVEGSHDKDLTTSSFQQASSSTFSEKKPRKSFFSSLGEALFKSKAGYGNPSTKSFEGVVKFCETRLHKVMKKEGTYPTWERLERLPLQAEKTATFLMYSHYQKGLTPTEKEISHASLRAKYELKRLPEIREGIITGWQKRAAFEFDSTKPKENEGVLAHMIAERLASIEGRLYFEAKEKGLPTPSNLLGLAQREFKQHKTQAKLLTQELSQKYSLSETAATSCAKDVLRYKEVHGEHPSDNQIANMARISQELDKKSYVHPYKELDHHEIDFLRRKEGDLLFRQLFGHDMKEHDLSHLPSVDMHSFFMEMSRYTVPTYSPSKQPPSLSEASMTHEPVHESTHEREYDYGSSM